MFFLNTDGGARGNPGPSALGFVIKDEKGVVVKSGGEYLGVATNNHAEYKGLIRGLSEALKMGIKELTCNLDSELVVKQVKGEYRVKEAHLKVLADEVRVLIAKFISVKVVYVPRAKNKEADKIVNEVLDGGR